LEEVGEDAAAGVEGEAGEVGVAADLVEEAEAPEFGVDDLGAEAVVGFGGAEGGAIDEGVAFLGEVLFGGPAGRVEDFGGRGVEERAEEGLLGAVPLAGGEGGFVGGVGGEGFGGGHGSGRGKSGEAGGGEMGAQRERRARGDAPRCERDGRARECALYHYVRRGAGFDVSPYASQ
jgi:hypothetical protein